MVHAAVVLLPLAFFGLLAVVALPRLAKTYGWLALGFLALGTVTAWAAKESGEKLAGQVGEPQTHAEGEISASPAPSAQAGGTYSMAQVQQHNTATDCWTVVGGTVYDLTKFVQQHPGGANRIISCAAPTARAPSALSMTQRPSPTTSCPTTRLAP